MSRSRGGPTRRPALRALADRLGIVPEYIDQTGKKLRRTSDETRVALLAVMGFPAGTERQARESLERLFAEDRATIVPAAVVIRQGEMRRPLLAEIDVMAADVAWSVSIRDESGNERAGGGAIGGNLAESTSIAYPLDLPPGYYDVTLRIAGGGGSSEVEQLLVVAPPACPSPNELLGDDRVFGLTANLYTVRSETNAGFGNFTDLRTLAEWGGEIGAAFIGVNPLHALFNRGTAISPYSPSSRLFRNPLYLDARALPEIGESAEARGLLDSPPVRASLTELRRADRIDNERIAATLDPVFRAAFRSLVDRRHVDRGGRWNELERYVAGGGQALVDYATFMALDAHHGGRKSRGGGRSATRSWRDWPARFRDPRSRAVAEFRAQHADEVMYHQWIQFALDTQLARAARAARDAGMRIGLYQDLAIGTSASGADSWANPGLFLSGASIGAPPDPYSDTGQIWGLPPIDPRRLALDGYRYWIDLVRASLRHAGALRIDHVMGLFQQFWIPEGATGETGAYVRFPASDLLGILALEATRARALVVGEDLGTVPPQVPPAMRERQILSSKVMLFERTPRGGFRGASTYPHLALATANTHDMPPFDGWLTHGDIALQTVLKDRKTGAEGTEGRRSQRLHAEREKEKRALLRRLAADGALPSARVPETGADLRGAVHRFLCSTPAALVGISLDDLAGEVEAVNVPGVGPDRFPSWTRRMTMSLDEIRSDEGVKRALGCERRR